MGDGTEKQPSTSIPEATITPVAAADAVYGPVEPEVEAHTYTKHQTFLRGTISIRILDFLENGLISVHKMDAASHATKVESWTVSRVNAFVAKEEAKPRLKDKECIEELTAEITDLEAEIKCLKADKDTLIKQVQVARAKPVMNMAPVSAVEVEVLIIMFTLKRLPDVHKELHTLRNAGWQVVYEIAFDSLDYFVRLERDKPLEAEKPADQEAPEAVSLTAFEARLKEAVA